MHYKARHLLQERDRQNGKIKGNIYPWFVRARKGKEEMSKSMA